MESPFSDKEFFMKYNKFAQSYFKTDPNIYFFLKDLGFKRIFKENGYCFPDNETKIIANKFGMEIADFHLTNNEVTKNYYEAFLEDIFKKTDFNNIDLDTCLIYKALTENLGVFGPFNNLTNQRIIYFNNKIEKLKPKNSNKTSVNKKSNPSITF